MRISFGIRVVDAAGNSVPSADVVVHYPYGEAEACTDESGWVFFEKEHYFGNSVTTTVYINGQMVDHFAGFEDGDMVTYTIDASAVPEQDGPGCSS